MSCHEDQGTAQPRRWDGPDESNVATSGFLQVMPVEFTREELRALLSKARVLAQYGIFNDTKRDLLVDLAETLDLLDALEARDEADLAELEETITEHSQSAGITLEPRVPCVPYPSPFDGWPNCSPRGGGE